jgi:hypothetical protein
MVSLRRERGASELLMEQERARFSIKVISMALRAFHVLRRVEPPKHF